MKRKLFLLLAVLLLGSLLPGPSLAQNTYERTWYFSQSDNFTISDSSKVVFKDGSVKLKPVDFVAGGYHTWYDTHFAGGGSSQGWDIEVDDEGYIYIAGLTNDGASGPDYGFIVKTDQNLNEIWYKRYFSGGGFQGIALASDRNLIAVGEYIDESDSLAYFKLFKINSQTGEVIWERGPFERGNSWIDLWGDGAGPELDRWGNIYYSHSAGPAGTGHGLGGNAPHPIYKFDPEGNLLWKRVDEMEKYDGEHPYHEDLWQMVVDSEGSVYISTTIASGLEYGDLNFGLTKYDTNGNFQWRKIVDVVDRWDAPRGLSIDSQDYIWLLGVLCPNQRSKA